MGHVVKRGPLDTYAGMRQEQRSWQAPPTMPRANDEPNAMKGCTRPPVEHMTAHTGRLITGDGGTPQAQRAVTMPRALRRRRRPQSAGISRMHQQAGGLHSGMCKERGTGLAQRETRIDNRPVPVTYYRVVITASSHHMRAERGGGTLLTARTPGRAIALRTSAACMDGGACGDGASAAPPHHRREPRLSARTPFGTSPAASPPPTDCTGR